MKVLWGKTSLPKKGNAVALRILLADDSLTAQNMGKKILTEAGYEVIAVSNGAQAMKKILSDNPDLVVLDVYMPGYSGLEICERMRSTRERATTPVLLSVGKMEPFHPEEGTRVRADGLIVKPFEATELLALVKKLAENVSPARAKRPPDAEPPEQSAEVLPPELEVQRQSVNIPQEIAAAPAVGIELIPQEAPQAESQEAPDVKEAPASEFEMEQAPAREEFDSSQRMSPAEGFSGVFELEPSAPAVSETAAAPAPVEESESGSAPAEAPAEFEQSRAPSDKGVAAKIEHDFVAAPPESRPEFTVPSGSETFSAPAAAEPAPSAEMEHESYSQKETSAGSGTAQRSELLPELSSWDTPMSAPPAEMPHVAAGSVLNNAQVVPAAPVWTAEEAEIDPHEFAIPLQQQMQASQAREPVSAATSADSPHEPTTFRPEPHSQAHPAPAAGFDDRPADHTQPALSPASSMVTEAPVERARIASIVDTLLARLKPELIAAVTRELEKNGQ